MTTTPRENFADAMQWVESFGFPQDTRHFHGRRTMWLFHRSGLHEALRGVPVAVMAGSCGKASTARFLAYIAHALLRRCNISGEIGLGTKPPLAETTDGNRERWQILPTHLDRPRWVEPAEFVPWVTELRTFVEILMRERPDLGPLASYDLRAWLLGRAFVARRVKLGIVEANIGLRRDSARAFSHACLYGLTPIGTDHATLLLAPRRTLGDHGDSAGPLWHKAGGVGRGVPLVLGRQDPQVEATALKLARARGAEPIFRCGPQGGYEVLSEHCDFSGVEARIRLGDDVFSARVKTVGRFHAGNAAQAAMMALCLQDRGLLPGDRSDLITAAVEGLAAADSPGRGDVVGRHPYVVRFVAMSLTKIQALCESMRALLEQETMPLVICASFLDRVHRAADCVRALAKLPRLTDWISITPPACDNACYITGEQMRSWVGTNARHHAFADAAAGLSLAKARARNGVVLVVGDGCWFHLAR